MHFKILLLGDSRVGKSSLLQKFVGETVNDFYVESLGVELKETIRNFSNSRIKLRIYDASGNPKLGFLLNQYLSIAQGVFVCFDVTNSFSFDNVENHVKKVKAAHSDIPIFLIGCKSDLSLERSVETEKIKNLAERLGLPYFATSSRKDVNVSEPFMQIMQQMYFLSLPQKMAPILEQHLNDYLNSLPQSNNFSSLFTTRSAKENLLIEEYKKNFAKLCQAKEVHDLEDFCRETLDIIERANLLFANENPILSVIATSPLSKTLGKILSDLSKSAKDFIDLPAFDSNKLTIS
ncbi:Rab family GTPase [Legionella steigerwaltii]|nr:Rab family GTPase [Legionella steigerwaltii]